MPAAPVGHPRARLPMLLAAAGMLLPMARAAAQEIRGFARLDARGDAVGGADVSLIDSLGREAGKARTDGKGEFLIRAPLPGTYWLQLSARTVGRTASPVFVLDSGLTLHYEHIFRRSLAAIARGDEITAQTVLKAPFRDSTSGTVTRGTSGDQRARVRVTVLDTRTGTPVPNAEVAIVAIDSRLEMVVGATTTADGSASWADLRPSWYRVVGRRIGLEPGGTQSFPIIGESDSVDVVLRLDAVTVLDEVKVMEQRITSFGFNLKLMARFYLGGDELRERNRAARNVEDLITSLRIPGLSIKTGEIESQMTYRGQRVRVFILDGSRTNGELPFVEPSSIESLMFIPPHEAGAIFGPDSSGGVLIINTRQK